jgi:hypothetical protein
MNTHPALIADTLDDLADIGDPWAPEPKPAPVAPAPDGGWHPMVRSIAQRLRRMRGIGAPSQVGPQGLDLGFLLACHRQIPGVFADLVRWRTGAHQAVPGARNALRHTLHATGVL